LAFVIACATCAAVTIFVFGNAASAVSSCCVIFFEEAEVSSVPSVESGASATVRTGGAGCA
jgi:hypothetical protein